MKHLRKFLAISAVGVVALGLTTSCEDLNLCDLTEDNLSMGDAFLETTSSFMNIVGRADQAIRNGELQTNGTATIDVATVTLTTDSLIIDFGNTNVVTSDGRSRRGKIVGSLTGDYFMSAGVMTLDLEDYYVDDTQIQGGITLTNNGVVNNEWSYDLTSSNFAIGTDYTYDANLNLAWLSGFTTQDSIADDVFTIGGAGSSATGTDLSNNVEFECIFTEALKFDRSCTYLVTEGIVDVSLDLTNIPDSSLVDVNVDFKSSDGCNNVVILTGSCEESTVSLPQNFDGF